MTRSRSMRGTCLAPIVALCVLAGVGCARVRMEIEPAIASCRTTIPPAADVLWVAPYDASNRGRLRAWCDAVGPVVHHVPQPMPAPGLRPLVLVSWNMAVGEGSVADLVSTLRRHPAFQGDPHFILLLQEAYRSGADVPRECPSHSGVGGRLGASRPAASLDIVGVAGQLGLHVAYAPSMRNGRRCDEEPLEDRGNAILSTLPLDHIVVIELPFAQQRRVAIAASVTFDGEPLTVVSTHFDTLLGHKRQARALLQTADRLKWDHRVVIAGDFNSHWLDPGPSVLKQAFTELGCHGSTHKLGGRLDHIYARGFAALPACEVRPERFGSDHKPLVAGPLAPR